MSSSTQPLAQSILLIDTETVRVTRWRFAPGDRTGWHIHGFAYVVVPLTDGELRIESREGENLAALQQGVPYDRPAGVEHDVVNAGSDEVIFVEIEMKAHPLI